MDLLKLPFDRRYKNTAPYSVNRAVYMFGAVVCLRELKQMIVARHKYSYTAFMGLRDNLG